MTDSHQAMELSPSLSTSRDDESAAYLGSLLQYLNGERGAQRELRLIQGKKARREDSFPPRPQRWAPNSAFVAVVGRLWGRSHLSLNFVAVFERMVGSRW